MNKQWDTDAATATARVRTTAAVCSLLGNAAHVNEAVLRSGILATDAAFWRRGFVRTADDLDARRLAARAAVNAKRSVHALAGMAALNVCKTSRWAMLT